MDELTEQMAKTLKEAARKMTGAKRRSFEAQVALDYLCGDARLAETVFGWSRHTVEKGLHELRTGQTIPDKPRRGDRKTEAKNLRLGQDIRDLVEPESQTDPKFQGLFKYTRMTVKAVRKALIEQKGYAGDALPHETTIGAMLNRMGYELRRVQKVKPLKKIKETNAIFENVKQVNAESDACESSLRISIDAKAVLKLGELSRHGTSRGKSAEKAQDKDLAISGKLVPFGILEVFSGLFTIIFGKSRETSDFIADCLDQWWEERKQHYPHIRELVINLDNGPSLSSVRTQFIKRLVEFSDRHELTIHLVYYPPYHSKYNAVERCWGILEMHWNGALLTDAEAAIEWAKTMTWKGISPVVKVLEGVYHTGVKVAKKVFRAFQKRLRRHNDLGKWDVLIEPNNSPNGVLCGSG